MGISKVVRRGSAVFVGAGLLLLAAPAALAAGGGPGNVVLPSVPALGPSAHASSTGGGSALTGTFRITAGSCPGGVSGSWFRMLSPAGSPVNNSDSKCSDQSYTPLSPGSDGGLVTGSYQADPSPAFDSGGNGLAHGIVQPAKFYGVLFAVATDRTDPQSGTAVGAPSISNSGGSLSGDLRAVTVAWNNQHFNQGAPKPDGSTPGRTTGPTGTYNPSTGAYKLTWSSQIVGGPFNNFTGTWQLEGTFVPSSAPAAATANPTSTGPTQSPAATPSDQSTSTGTGASSTSASSGGTATGSSLPTTGANEPLLPAAGLLAAGLVVRRLARRDGPGRSGPGRREDRP